MFSSHSFMYDKTKNFNINDFKEPLLKEINSNNRNLSKKLKSFEFSNNSLLDFEFIIPPPTYNTGFFAFLIKDTA